MSAIHSVVHRTREGETLDSLVQKYQLSSRLAILDAEKNAAIRAQLSIDGGLATGLFVQIPPNAERLIQRRIFTLNQLRPVLLAHFDTLEELAASELHAALLNDTPPYGTANVSNALRDLEEFVAASFERFGGNSHELAELGIALSLTHVATTDDHALAAGSRAPNAGLNWAVSSAGLARWQSMWSRDHWDEKWDSVSSGTAVRLTTQYIRTVRSIVVQHTDQRVRQALQLQRLLLAE